MPANPQLVAFATAHASHNDIIDKAVDGIAADVTGLKKRIADLDARPPGWTPEDQTILDDITTRTAALVTKVEALDAATENAPDPPPVDPVPPQP